MKAGPMETLTLLAAFELEQAEALAAAEFPRGAE